MKICALSDLHGYLNIEIPECNILILAGDISWNGNYKWYSEVFCDWLTKIQKQFDICFLVFGNHDDNIYMDKSNEDIYKNLPDNVIILNNENYEYKGIKFFGSPNCRYIHGFRNTMSEDTLEYMYNKMDKDVDIVITHSPPYGIGDVSKGNEIHLGSISLFKQIEEVKPKIHIFGHVHSGNKYTRQNKTDFYNVSILNENYKLEYPITCVDY
jgi:Icc-related predicted phosphoesterase